MTPTEYIGFQKLFPAKLKFWSWHCLINALPSYLIAVVWLQLWQHPIAHVSMAFAVLTFVLGYSVATSLPGPLANKDSLFSRAVKVGLIIRLIISFLTVCLVPTGVLLLFTPDYWSGQLAVSIVNEIYSYLGLEGTLLARVNDGRTPGISVSPGFLEVYLSTVLEGLILSFMLFILCVMAIIILQMRDRKRMFREGRI
ncbi:MAG: hypothetical protein ABJQ29_02795 [Luteolibacter sp.]